MNEFFNRFRSQAKSIEQVEPGFGAFEGVYTPSILTILGVIMYLKFGWVLGHVGLINTLLIVTISTSITFLTALSIAQIATDQVVRAGGAYYMISRSLGIEIGGAIGVPLFFAQAFSVALYTLGFAESLARIFPAFNVTVTALITTILVAGVAIKSANIALKAQYLIMTVIVLSLVSLVLGKPLDGAEVGLMATPVGDKSFWAVLAVFFPAVTGIMAGVNMSGDLKDPADSIPKGTLAAVITGYVIYMIIPLILCMRADFQSLVDDELIMQRISLVGELILLGVWGATLSSAIGSILGAPRVLQALVRDRIFPHWLNWLGKGEGPGDEPRLGTLFTLGIALAVVCLGDLELVAPVLSMFFLTTYLVLNTVACIESFMQSPSFRPTFKVHWIWSLLGAIGCLTVMFLINAVATIAAAVIVIGIYFWLERQELESTWGDARRGFWLTLIRMALYKLGDTPDAKNWRPHLLVFTGAPTRRWPLVQMASDLTHNRGLVTLASILPKGSRDREQQSKLEGTLRDLLKKNDIQAFVRVTAGETPFEGAQHLVDGYGIGPLTPNTVLVGQTGSEAGPEFCEMVRHVHSAQRNVLILRLPEDGESKENRAFPRIDVWWGGLKGNGALMLIVADQLRLSDRWRNAEIYLKLVVPDEASVASAQENLKNRIQELRLNVTPDVIVARERSFPTLLKSASKNASLVILGMALPDENFVDYYQDLQQRTADLPLTLFVLASEKLSFSEVLMQS